MLISHERFDLAAAIKSTMLLGGLIAVLAGIAELSRSFWPAGPLTGFLVIFAACTYVILTYLVADERTVVRFIAHGGGELMVVMLVVAMLGSTVLFGLVCRELHNLIDAGFQGVTVNTTAAWIGFGFDNLFESLFLDAPAIYGLNFVNIQADNFWTQTLVLVFRTLANLVTLKVIIRYWFVLHRYAGATRV